MQFLVRIKSLLPADFPAQRREKLIAQEKAKSKELAESGKLIGHWQVPLTGESLTLWEVLGPEELHQLVRSLPASAWVTASATALVNRNLRDSSQDSAQKVT
jgi:muconolactone D-isomerase